MNHAYGLDPIPGSDAPWTAQQEEIARQFLDTRDWIMNESLRFYHAARNGKPLRELQEMQAFMRERTISAQTQLDELRKAGISERAVFERRERLCIGLKNGG